MQQGRQFDAFAAAAAAGGHEGGPPIGQLILRRKWLLLFGLAVGVGLGYLYFTQQPPVFRTVAQILVTPNRAPMPGDQQQRDDALADANAIETQCQILTSPNVILNAIETSNLIALPEFENDKNKAIAAIMKGLTAQPMSKGSRVIAVDYLGSSPQESQAVVAAIVKSYREFLGETDQAVSEDSVKLISQAKDELLKDLEKLEADYAKFRRELPLLGQGDEIVNPHAVRLTSIDAEKTNLILQSSQLRAKIDAITDALERGGSREALSLMVDQLKNDGSTKPEAVTVAETLFPLLLEKELQSENLGPGHPKIVALDKQISMTRSHLDSLLNLGGEPGAPKDLLEVYLDSMRYEIETTRVQLDKLNEIFTAENELARELDTTLTRDRQLREEIQRKASLLEVVIKQLEQMTLFSTEGIRTQVIADPAQGVQTPEERAKHMAVGGALGLLFVSFLAYLLESNDKSFRNPEDIRDELGLSVLGHVPVISNKSVAPGSTAAPALCTVHVPKGQSSEAFRLVRTALFFGARSGNLKIIQVTSPDQGDGKSTVSANLAVAVAQSGRKTLLIDADMRRPTVHRLFGLNNDLGTADVIAEQVEPADAIHKSQIPNLSIMVCGPRPHNPAELLASHRFDEFLAWARDNYDFVIIDTPPLLAVSDPGNVASRVDGVMLTLRLGKRARAKGTEARDVLERVGANILGIIINGVNARGEYGYQSGYRYTAASTARYGYGETYFSNDYVEDERREHRRPRHVNGHATPTPVKET